MSVNAGSIKKIKKLLSENTKKSSEIKHVFFKTAPGSYAEHDIFIGVTVPVLRKIAKKFYDLSLSDIKILLSSKINEERLLALFILSAQYKNGTTEIQDTIYSFYMNNLTHVNNWNLVDSSAHLILGAHLEKNHKKILVQLAKSDNLWERRIAIIATLHFIRQNQTNWTFRIANMLLQDNQDLIHKATGWMLREAGKKDEAALHHFLSARAAKMPRTMLRYAIEKFDEQTRKKYLYKK